MELVRWKPLRSFNRLPKEMDDLVDQFFGRTAFPEVVQEEYLPSVDISETKNKLVIKADLPGLDVKDIEASISGDLLVIKGEKKKEEEEKDEHHHRVERYYGSIKRSIRLPVSVKTDKISATFDKSVLKITLPKTTEAKKKKLEIKTK